MNFTYAERQDAAVKACNEWLSTKWGQHYQEMVKYLPEDKADEVRLMLQRSIRQAMSYRPNELVSVAEVNRQYCNLLDSNRLETHEALAELFKNAALQTNAAATEAKRERAEIAAIVVDAAERAELEQSIADRATDDAANRKVDIKELRRRALFSERNERGHIETTPMPASIQIFSRSPKQ
ncbi:MAG: hypothetical protein WCC03_18360 [Candidatus Acidiferrales bacterium]